MDSFKIYLPSNASSDHFPNNTPSNYQTHLTDPIQLEGEWEAGLESIFYSNEIGNEKEKVRIDFEVEAARKIYVTDVYPYTLQKSDDGRLLGYGIYPREIETSVSDRNEVGFCLNSINHDLVLNHGKVGWIFTFRDEHGTFTYFGGTNGVVLDITAKLARYLGFGYQHIFVGNTPIVANEKRVIPKSLTKDDYCVRFVDTNILRKVKRIIIKRPDRLFPKSRELFVESWKNIIYKPYDIDIEFSKTGKLIVHNYNDFLTIKFSYDLSKSFHIAQAIIGRKTEWALRRFDDQKSYEKDYWFIDIYSDEIDYTISKEIHSVFYEFQPRIFDDVHQLIPVFNHHTKTKLKDALTTAYDETKHNCELSLPNNHTKLIVGEWIKLKITRNLSFILGFDEERFQKGEYLSKKLPATLQQREQHLFVLTDFIQSINYGDVKVDVLEEFVHDDNGNEKIIIEKRFQPISYHPVKRSYIENVQIQIVNEIFNPVFIRDSKTIVILHLRKRK